MKLSTLLAFLPPEQRSALPDDEVAGITCDSRRVSAGWVFVCIRGTAQDGHAYAQQAADAGALLIVAEHDTGAARQLLVAATRPVWAQMCAAWFGHPADRLRLIGVTGTNGKTTSTYLLKAVLEECGYKVGLIGTIQNMIGTRVLPSGHTTPDPYDLQSMLSLMAAEGCGFAVMEVSSHALDQDRVEGCRFETALFTNLTQDHLDYHGTMEAYAAAKRRLFFMSDTAVVNADDPWARAVTEGVTARVATYSCETASDYTARDCQLHPGGVSFELTTGGVTGRVRLGIPGKFSVYNALGVTACALELGLPLDKVTRALEHASGVKGRAELVPTDEDFTVVIDYAHTPDGLDNICRTLKDCAHGRLVTLFGCGGDRDKTKRPKMGAIAAAVSDFLVVTSDNPRTEDPDAIIRDILVGVEHADTPYIVIPNRVEAIEWAIGHAQTGDTLLLAGKGHETYQILATGVIHLDEREVVAAALEKRRKTEKEGNT